MPLKSCQRYEFIATGVGCVTHGDPGCLCDVVVEQPLPVAALPGGFQSVQDLLDNAETVLTEAEVEGAKRRIRTIIQSRDTARQARQYKLFRALWDEGLTTYEICERISIQPSTLFQAAIPGFNQEWTSPLLHVEQLAITGATADDLYQVACPPLNKQAVDAHVRRLGLVLPPSRVEQAVIRARLLVAGDVSQWSAANQASKEFEVSHATVYDQLTGRRKRQVV